MGMFDYVHYKCPSCGELVEEQSKAADCDLNHYFLGDIAYELPEFKDCYDEIEEILPAPLEILAEVQRYGLTCTHCGTHTKIRLGVPSFVYIKEASHE